MSEPTKQKLSAVLTSPVLVSLPTRSIKPSDEEYNVWTNATRSLRTDLQNNVSNLIAYREAAGTDLDADIGVEPAIGMYVSNR